MSNTHRQDNTAGRKALAARFRERLTLWMGDLSDTQTIEEMVEELLVDSGYAPQVIGRERLDPVAFRIEQREYNREYARVRRERQREARANDRR